MKTGLPSAAALDLLGQLSPPGATDNTLPGALASWVSAWAVVHERTRQMRACGKGQEQCLYVRQV